MPSIGSRRGKRLIAATIAIAATGGSAALAFTGQPGSNGPTTSAAPDVLSVTITRTVTPTSPLGPQARFCFDETVNQASIQNTAWRIGMYDTLQRVASTSATIDTGDAKCVIATFANGEQIQQGTVAYFLDGAVRNNANTPSPAQSAPLDGTEITPIAGATTAPDLVDTEVNAGATPPQISYTFDEALDPTLPTTSGAPAAAAQLANKFGFYVLSDNGNAPRRGDTVIGIDNKTIVIGFAPTDTVNSARAFFFDPLGAGANARDRIVNDSGAPNLTNTQSPISSVIDQPITGGPSLVSAVKQAGSNGQIVDLTFAQAVNPGAVGAAAPGGNVVAYRADANPIGGTYAIGTSGANTQTLPLTMPATTQRDSTSVVRVGIRPGLIRNQANDRDNIIAHAAISTEPAQKGLTDAPDLLRTTVDDATNRVTFVFDEALRQSPDPSGTEFDVINTDASFTSGDAGSANVSADRKSVSVKFGGSVSASALAGVSNNLFAVTDAVDDPAPPATSAGNDALPGSVSLQAIACQPGTCPVTPTPTPTTTVTVTPTPTVTQEPGQTIRIKTKVTARKRGKRITGKVKAAAPCRAGRKVSSKGKSTKSKGNGSYTLKFKTRVKGKPTVKVAARTIKRGTTTFKCSAASKRAS